MFFPLQKCTPLPLPLRHTSRDCALRLDMQVGAEGPNEGEAASWWAAPYPFKAEALPANVANEEKTTSGAVGFQMPSPPVRPPGPHTNTDRPRLCASSAPVSSDATRLGPSDSRPRVAITTATVWLRRCCGNAWCVLSRHACIS